MTRLSCNISDDTARTLRGLAEKHSTSVTDIIRRVTVTYGLFDTAVREGKEIHLVTFDKNGNELERKRLVLV